MENVSVNVVSSPKSRSPDSEPHLDPQAVHLTDLFLVAYLEMCGHRIEPFISTDGPFENMISFNVYGEVKEDMDDYHDPKHYSSLVDFLRSYKSVRNQMWNMKEVAKKRGGK